MRFRIPELIRRCNLRLPPGERLTIDVLAETINVPRSTLAGLTTWSREPVTNTATLECLIRFFHKRIDGFQIAMLLEFEPELGATDEERQDRLYPKRAARSREQTRANQPRGRRGRGGGE